MKAAIALVLLIAFAPWVAHARNCQIDASPVVFGDYRQGAANSTDSRGVITVNCSGNGIVVLVISLNAGTNASGRFNRRLRFLGSFLAYQLYTDQAHTTVWGDGTAGTVTVQDTFPCIPPCNRIIRAFEVYGSIPGLQQPRPGVYLDTITATVVFN